MLLHQQYLQQIDTLKLEHELSMRQCKQINIRRKNQMWRGTANGEQLWRR